MWSSSSGSRHATGHKEGPPKENGGPRDCCSSPATATTIPAELAVAGYDPMPDEGRPQILRLVGCRGQFSKREPPIGILAVNSFVTQPLSTRSSKKTRS